MHVYLDVSLCIPWGLLPSKGVQASIEALRLADWKMEMFIFKVSKQIHDDKVWETVENGVMDIFISNIPRLPLDHKVLSMPHQKAQE